MNLQQMMIHAQKMNRELQKKQEELAKKEFVEQKGGAVTVTVYGSHQVKSIEIDPDAFQPEDREMIQEMIVMALNEANQKIDEEADAIQQAVTSRMPF